jgi:DNA-binding response OmpR family regulator
MPGRVLVVDDEREIRELCRVNLELEGFDVVEAADGAAALAAARAEVPDIIFLDLMMPGIDGWAVLEQLKADPSTADIPVVLLTARASEDDQLRGWEAGIFDFVAKPFNPLALADLAVRAMDPNHPAAAAERRTQMLDQLRYERHLRRPR